MTDLSPAAQAVLDAAWKEMDYAPSRLDTYFDFTAEDHQ